MLIRLERVRERPNADAPGERELQPSTQVYVVRQVEQWAVVAREGRSWDTCRPRRWCVCSKSPLVPTLHFYVVGVRDPPQLLGAITSSGVARRALGSS